MTCESLSVQVRLSVCQWLLTHAVEEHKRAVNDMVWSYAQIAILYEEQKRRSLSVWGTYVVDSHVCSGDKYRMYGLKCR